ncbi:specific transcription factor domain protein [Aspergillus parasiticus SU-1]|uniref:Specific transcription factor domain protein n=1 Tax=Aspergillus parasiticus (strain ATCC 56775 / NRRL 5862 / SRRC 143 / SU-1) TaxID=1403190 RepID=A0A0F0IEI6_ASPPU|nr:specific transcription factor domain protein [Aspergillus parasiticus SU-1]
MRNLTRGHSCVLCQQRKVRCDQQKPCANCVKAQVECRVLPPQPPKRRRKKLHERDLIDRLRKYEALMSQHGISFDSVLEGEDGVANIEHDYDGLGTAAEGSAQNRNSPEHGKRSKWFPYYQEYCATDDMLRDTSDDENERPTIHHSFDTMFGDTDGFPFNVCGSPAQITDLHPPAIKVFQLWQVYINNVNPLLKISHVPTLQAQVVEAAADPAKIPKPLEALMFGIYLVAVTSLTDEEVEATFDEGKAVLLSRYHQGTQQALINAGFMRSNELMVLQAYFLYLFCIVQYVDPRSLFCLIGIAVRIATGLGLHRDGTRFGLSPFETEQRKRLWWQIVAFDKRIAEVTGSTITALSSSATDSGLPLNVNDADLHIHAKEPPTPSTGATEMLFCLTRIELTMAAVPNGMRPNPVALNNPFAQHKPTTSPADATTQETSSQPPTNGLNRYCAHMESTYLAHCDHRIPVQFFALMMARVSLCRLRIVDFMSRGVSATTLEYRERDALFMTAIEMLEYDNTIHTTPSLRNFLWYTQLLVPLPGYVFLVGELRQRTTGELCERAWKAIYGNYNHRGLIRKLRSPMHVAFGHMLLKAWNAHEEAELQLGRNVQPPQLVTLLRERVALQTSTSHSKPDLARNGSTDSVGTTNGGPVAGTRMWVDDNTGLDRMGRPSEVMSNKDSMFPSLHSASQMFDEVSPDQNDVDWSYLMQPGVLGELCGNTGPIFTHSCGFNYPFGS